MLRCAGMLQKLLSVFIGTRVTVLTSPVTMIAPTVLREVREANVDNMETMTSASGPTGFTYPSPVGVLGTEGGICGKTCMINDDNLLNTYWAFNKGQLLVD